MKITKELRGLSSEEFKTRKEDFQKELLKLNVQVASGANPKEAGKIKMLRKALAIIETLSNEKSLKEREVLAK